MSAPSSKTAAAPAPGAGWAGAGFGLGVAFVLLWSTGFIGAKLATPHVEPLTVLSLRFAMAGAALALFAAVAGAAWPRGRELGAHALIGLLNHGLYLGGVFIGISWGLESGLSALIAGTAPVATAAIASAVYGDRLRGLQWLGLGLGVVGVALVVARKLGEGGAVEAGFGPLAGALATLLAMTAFAAGSVLQSRWTRPGGPLGEGAPAPVSTTLATQFLSAALLTGLAALLFERQQIDPAPAFWIALLWMVFALSLGAIPLFYALLRRGAVAEASSLVFLTPGCTAVIAFFTFGERLGAVELLGLVTASLGVAMVTGAGPFKRAA